ncbi:hypothetical protein HMPREF9946_00656 [Acetobacteraceae bacterium AT-5844]|nr:hypothetical protein HMPREF9946_00656 [Acetobacteraceae bacterium AT-5844]
MKRLASIWERNFLYFEFLLCLIMSIFFSIWIFTFNGFAFLEIFLQGNRSALYGAIASIFGSLLGFIITATSIVLGFSSSERLAVVRESKQYGALWKTFISTIRSLAFATITALVCLLIDRDNNTSRTLLAIMFFLFILSLFRVARSIWAMENIILLVTHSPPKRAPS